MRFRVLGSLEPRLASENQRILLTMLLLGRGNTVSADTLIEALWGDALPTDPGAALRTQVSRLRSRSGVAIERRGAGYRLDVGDDEVDLVLFEQRLGAGDLDGALALWHGRALGEFADRPFAEAEARRLEELYLDARERRAELGLAAAPADAVAELEALVTEHPERERARGLLMEALYRAGRQTEALEEFQSWRRHLAEELGLDPSPALARLERQILQHAVDPASIRAVPRPVSSFVGRRRELAQLSSVLERARLVTLLGAGGVGKTRLALEVTNVVARRYADVWFCDLGAVERAGQVLRAVASAVGLSERGTGPVRAQLVDHLATADALLIFDNCEHLIDAVALIADDVIRRTPVAVLATSRERLGVDGEHVYSVAPLDAGEAATLFTERARALDSDFAAAPNVVADLCQRLDHLPLAIELAAARTRAMDVDRLAAALDDRFQLLTAGSRVTTRHRSLAAVVGWSYEHLSERDRIGFERMSVFAGNFDLDSAVALGIEADVVLALADRSLVTVHRGAGVTRYSLLDTLRIFGRERQAERGALDEVRDDHAAWALVLARDVAAGLATPAEGQWAALMTRHLDELRAAHAWLVGRNPLAALELSDALHPYAFFRARSEVFRWAEVAVTAAAAVDAPPTTVAAVTASAAAGAWQRGELDLAISLANSAASHRRAPEVLGDVAVMQGNLQSAIDWFSDAEARARRDDDILQAVWDGVGAVVARVYGGHDARAEADRVLGVAKECGSPSALATAYFARGEVYDSEEDLRLALTLARSVDAELIAGLAEVALAALLSRGTDIGAAREHYESVIRSWRQAGAWAPQWVTLRTLTQLLTRFGAFDDAAILYGAVASAGSSPAYGADAAMLRDLGERLRIELGETRFAEHVARGETMAADDVVESALAALARTRQVTT